MDIESFYNQKRTWCPMWVTYALVEYEWDGNNGGPMFSNQQDAYAWGKLNYPNKRLVLKTYQFKMLNNNLGTYNPVPWIDGNLNLLLND